MFKPSRILVPTDMSEHSDKALSQAIDIANQFNAKVFLLHVIEDLVQQWHFDYSVNEEMVKEIQAHILGSAWKAMRKQLEKFPLIVPDEISFNVRTGTPYKEILKEAEDKEIDLIVIASLGSTGLAKYLMGGVARHILLGAKCSVLLTK